MPEFTTRTFLQNEASLATQILAASRHEQSQPTVPKPQPSKRPNRSSDSASVKSTSSFGSTVSLLKSKFHRHEESKMDSEQQRRLQRSGLRNQVRIGC